MMSIYRRIKILEQQTEAIKLSDAPQFYESTEDYEKALKDNKIKEHHICFIDDVIE